MSKLNRIKIAYEQGYRVRNGEVFSGKGNKLKLRLNDFGYPMFSFRVQVKYLTEQRRKTHIVHVHRLVAYQKYGDAMFEPGIVVRHKDGNPLNAQPDNILIGTHSDNMMDKSVESRRKSAIAATVKNRVLTDEQVVALKHDRHVLGMSYRLLAIKYGIRDKSHAHYIANHDYVSVKTE
jgi:hypothetical protein